MATNFQQEDTAMDCTPAVFCTSSFSVNGDTDAAQKATVGGTAGSTEVTITQDAGVVNTLSVWWELTGIDDYDGASGNWTIPLNVTTGNHQLTWNLCAICRVNSSCTNQETLANDNTISENLGGTGVRSVTVNQASSTTISTGDKIIVVLLINNGSAGMTQDWGYTPDQIIVAPGTISGGASGAGYYQHYYKSVVTMMSRARDWFKSLWEQRPARLLRAA